MKPLTQDLCKLRRIGQCLLTFGLWAGICTFAQAAGYTSALDAQAFNPIAQNSASDTPVILCGGQPGQRRPASLKIRGADVATLWRSAYRMLVPGSSLANESKVGRAPKLPHKGPAWGISLRHDSALLTVQSKW